MRSSSEKWKVESGEGEGEGEGKRGLAREPTRQQGKGARDEQLFARKNKGGVETQSEVWLFRALDTSAGASNAGAT
jgi:hypothetical protein